MKNLSHGKHAPQHHEKGAALIIGLVLLMALTIIGVSVLSTTSLEQRMAGNMTDLNLAFNAAETAGRVFSAHVNANPGDDPIIVCLGLNNSNCISENLPNNWWENAGQAWWSASAIDMGTTLFANPLPVVDTQPQIIIEHKPNPDISRGHGYLTPGNPLFIITTRGTGASDNTEVVIQQVITQQ